MRYWPLGYRPTGIEKELRTIGSSVDNGIRNANPVGAELLSEQAVDELRLFVKTANWTQLHPLDRGRFYHFIVGCHQRGEDNLLPSQLVELMRELGAPDPGPGVVDLAPLGSLYEKGLELLEYYDEYDT